MGNNERYTKACGCGLVVEITAEEIRALGAGSAPHACGPMEWRDGYHTHAGEVYECVVCGEEAGTYCGGCFGSHLSTEHSGQAVKFRRPAHLLETIRARGWIAPVLSE